MAASRLAQWKNGRAFKKAKRQAEETGQRVCGTYRDGEPVYFVVPAEASDVDIEEQAFLAVHGRARDDGERMLAHMARPYMAPT